MIEIIRRRRNVWAGEQNVCFGQFIVYIMLEFRISWAVTLWLGKTWWLEHEASTVSDMNHSSIDIKSPLCQLFYNSVSNYSVKYKDRVSPRRRDESELYSNKKEKNCLLLHIYLLQVMSLGESLYL
jgi:hypothetical protein